MVALPASPPLVCPFAAQWEACSFLPRSICTVRQTHIHDRLRRPVFFSVPPCYLAYELSTDADNFLTEPYESWEDEEIESKSEAQDIEEKYLDLGPISNTFREEEIRSWPAFLVYQEAEEYTCHDLGIDLEQHSESRNLRNTYEEEEEDSATSVLLDTAYEERSASSELWNVDQEENFGSSQDFDTEEEVEESPSLENRASDHEDTSFLHLFGHNNQTDDREMVVCENHQPERGCHFRCVDLLTSPGEQESWECPDCVASKPHRPRKQNGRLQDHAPAHKDKSPDNSSPDRKVIKKEAWTKLEDNLVIELLKEIMHERIYNQKEGKFAKISERLLKNYNVNRTTASVKNRWCRNLRASCGIDERIVKNPEKLATSVMTSEQKAGRRKRKGEKGAPDDNDALESSVAKRRK